MTDSREEAGIPDETVDVPIRAILHKSSGISHFRFGTDFKSLEVEPENDTAYNGLAWLWATCPDARFRDGKKAVESATRACELSGWKEANYIDTLAVACAEVGDFDAAIKWQVKANAMYDEPESRKNGLDRLELYRAKTAYREP